MNNQQRKVIEIDLKKKEEIDDDIIQCPDCKSENRRVAKFCCGCGLRLRAITVKCSSCGAQNKWVDKYCLTCNTPLYMEDTSLSITPSSEPVTSDPRTSETDESCEFETSILKASETRVSSGFNSIHFSK